MKLYTLIIKSDWMYEHNPYVSKERYGWGNGYVLIPKEHPYFKKHYYYDNLEMNLNIHGGVTFCNFWTDEKLNDTTYEFLDDIPDNVSDYWAIGFDTLHYGDDLINCPKEYVIQQTNYLKEQLLNVLKNEK